MVWGGYILWHTILVDDSGLGKSFFYVLLPNETGICYCRAIIPMKSMQPCTGNVKTVVVDSSLTQLNAMQTTYPKAESMCLRIHRSNGTNAACEE